MVRRNLDFLILYENKIRELESVCSLKCELKRRGYKVKIAYVHSFWKQFMRPTVIVVPYLYSDNEIRELLYCGKNFVNKVVNLQWEQILNSHSTQTGFHSPKNGAETGVHISWGISNENSLLHFGVPKENLFVTGSMNMDFCNKRALEFYGGKRVAADKYNLDVDKKWILFISSFTMTNNYVYEMVNRTVGKNNETDNFRLVSIESQNIILSWFSKILDENEDTIIIYRPHPAELGNELLNQMEYRNSRFYCIGDESVRYWITACDYIYTWFSTSIVDAYFMEKPCLILRPKAIPNNLEVDIMKGANYIKTVEEMLHCKDNIFPIHPSKIELFYGAYKDGKAYCRVADVCEKVYAGDKYKIKGVYPPIKRSIKYYIYLFLAELCKYVRLSKFFGKKRNLFENVEKNTYHSHRLEKEICKKIEAMPRG